jgi:DNA helicase HerA-like ATPase
MDFGINKKMSKIGRVVSTENGPTFSSVPIRVDSGKIVKPGQLLYSSLLNKFTSRESVYVLRVSSAKEENPYEDPQSSNVKQIFNIETEGSDNEQVRKFVIADTSPLEIVSFDNGKAITSSPDLILPAGTEVYDNIDDNLARAVLGFPSENDPKSIYLGTLVGATKLPVALDANVVLPRHILIVGSTGTGKSYLLGKIVEEIHNKGLCMVNIDIHGEMNKATLELGGRVVIPGADLKIKLSSLEEPEIMGMLSLGHDLHIDIVSKSIINLKSSGKDFSASELEKEAEKVAYSFGAKKPTVDIISARIQQLSNIPFLGEGFDWKTGLLKNGAIINVDCRSLPYTYLQLVVAAIARDIYNNRKNGAIKPIVMGIDEAHLFIPSAEKANTTTILSQLIRMGRHVSMGLVLVSQSPGDLDKRVAKITNTRFVFAIEPSELNSIYGFLADAPKELVDSIPRMRTGTCLLVGNRETVRHATVFEVGTRKTTHGGDTPRMID